MEKPKNVDKDAKWMRDAWHKGKLSKAGKPSGRYTMWSEEGVLTDDGEFDGHGKIKWFKSYYSDGSIGRSVEYDGGLKQTKVIYKSYHKQAYRLLTPLAMGAKGHAEKIYEGKLSVDNKEIFNGSAEGVSFYNENGELINTYESKNYQSLIEKFSKKKKAETWKEALERLSNYWNALKVQLVKDDVDLETECEDSFTVSFEKKVTKKDLINAEKRLGVELPESYKNFVLNEGLIKFGDVEYAEQRMLHPKELQTVEYMLDPENEGYFKSYFKTSKEKRDKIICFFLDQDDIQYDGWIAFDCINEGAVEKNIITSIGCKDIYEWEEEVAKENKKGLNSMDQFISDYVDVLIKEREA